MSFIVETCVARHAGDRSEQQDRAAAFGHPSIRGVVMAVLADGMGGYTGGDLAAEHVLLEAKHGFDAYLPESGGPRQLLEKIISDAHRLIRRVHDATEMAPHSTAVALMLESGRASWIHCGDSRVYHFRGTQIISRSQDHSVVAELQRRGRLDAAAASIHPRRNVLLSCLGSERQPQVAIGEAQACAGDSFLLCSDGLWGHFSDDELARTIAAKPAQEAARTLVEIARKRAAGCGDNISLIIIRVGEADPKAAPDDPPA